MPEQIADQMDLDLGTPKKPTSEEERSLLIAEYKKAVGVLPRIGLGTEGIRTGMADPEKEKARLRLEELEEPNNNLPFQPKRR
jgi:hypothetical protein